MRKSFASEEIKISRQQILPDVNLEYFQQLIDNKNYYILKIEVLTCRLVNLLLDFSKSINIELVGKHEHMIKEIKAEPFTKILVAKIKVSHPWQIDLNLKIELHRPNLQLQKKVLEPYEMDLQTKIQKNRIFDSFDLKGIPEDVIFALLKNQETNFVDLEFVPDDNSWCSDYSTFQQTNDLVIHWRRAKYLYYPLEKAILVNEVPPNFFQPPNKLENDFSAKQFIDEFSKTIKLAVKEQKESFTLKTDFCFNLKKETSDKCFHFYLELIFNSLFEFPNLLQKIISTAIPNKQGFYRLNLFKLGKDFPVIIDDYIPCLPFGGLANTHYQGNGLPCFGLILLEKAISKLHGNYEFRKANLVSLLLDIVGVPAIECEFTCRTKDHLDVLWIRLQSWKRQGHMLFACHDFHFEDHKIESSEDAASILDFSKIDLIKTDENNDRLVYLRKPSASSQIINEGIFKEESIIDLPLNRWAKIFEEPNPKGKFAKRLILPLELFARSLKSVVVCQLGFANQIKIKGKFVTPPHQSSLNSEHGVFMSRFVYELVVSKETLCVIGIYQEDQNWAAVAKIRPNIDIGLVVFKRIEGHSICQFYLKPRVSREIFGELILTPGKYLVAPVTVGMQENKSASFSSQKEFQGSDLLFKSVVDDIFDKFNMSGSDYLFYEELSAFFKVFQINFTQEKYQKLVQDQLPKFAPNQITISKPPGLFRKSFALLFARLLETKKLGDSAFEVFKMLGYDQNYFSFGSRLFGLTVHSEEHLTMESREAVNENIEQLIFETILGREGKELVSIKNGDLNASVYCASLE